MAATPLAPRATRSADTASTTRAAFAWKGVPLFTDYNKPRQFRVVLIGTGSFNYDDSPISAIPAS
ncbi:hypothetical protein SS37A_38360 (plasmid) [Methylocystis iwaonis]|uniref:Uncharacterized protein n=1 Tax=Methylocystis iwaonis TaxID=2885079 RepID=A0ABM8EE71_9HYPH|nr:hypothetical protein SS37A_38360 [Methylocystis iwaonis]